MAADRYDEYLWLMTDRSLTESERGQKLAELKASVTSVQLDKMRARFFEGK